MLLEMLLTAEFRHTPILDSRARRPPLLSPPFALRTLSSTRTCTRVWNAGIMSIRTCWTSRSPCRPARWSQKTMTCLSGRTFSHPRTRFSTSHHTAMLASLVNLARERRARSHGLQGQEIWLRFSTGSTPPLRGGQTWRPCSLSLARIPDPHQSLPLPLGRRE